MGKKKKKLKKKLSATAKATAKAPPQLSRKGKAKAKKAKRNAPAQAKNTMSATDAAASVLKKANKPLSAGAIYALTSKAGSWKSNAPTPANTMHSALSTEIKRKGAKARFTHIKGKGFSPSNGAQTTKPKAKVAKKKAVVA